MIKCKFQSFLNFKFYYIFEDLIDFYLRIEDLNGWNYITMIALMEDWGVPFNWVVALETQST